MRRRLMRGRRRSMKGSILKRRGRRIRRTCPDQAFCPVPFPKRLLVVVAFLALGLKGAERLLL